MSQNGTRRCVLARPLSTVDPSNVSLRVGSFSYKVVRTNLARGTTGFFARARAHTIGVYPFRPAFLWSDTIFDAHVSFISRSISQRLMIIVSFEERGDEWTASVRTVRAYISSLALFTHIFLYYNTDYCFDLYKNRLLLSSLDRLEEELSQIFEIIRFVCFINVIVHLLYLIIVINSYCDITFIFADQYW